LAQNNIDSHLTANFYQAIFEGPVVAGGVNVSDFRHIFIQDTASGAISGDHYGIYIESLNSAAGSEYAIYTNDGFVRFGDHVSVGGGSTPAADTTLLVDETYTDPAGVRYGIQVLHEIAITGNHGTPHRGGVIGLDTTANAFDYTSPSALGASQSRLRHYGTGTIAAAIGATGNIVNTTTGPITDARAVLADIVNQSTAIITDAYLFYGTTISNASGTVTTGYGLYLEDQDEATTNYAIYTNAGLVRFGDDLIWGSGAGLAYAGISGYNESDTIAIAGAGIANKAQVTSFDTNDPSNNCTPDHTNDHITIVEAGDYMVTCSITAESAAAGGGDTIGFGIWKNNGATEYQNLHAHRLLTGGGGDVGSISISGVATFAASDTVELWVYNEDSGDDVVINDVSLALVQVGS
jgi:hypothetical protein